MSSKQAQKGSRFEYKIRDMLREKTGTQWERTPLSGGGTLKGDLYCVNANYYYCFECKSFADSVIMENLLTAKSNNLFSWWEQCVREAKQMNRTPALVFKKDRGKPLIAVEEELAINYLHIASDLGEEYVNVFIYPFELWLAEKNAGDISG